MRLTEYRNVPIGAEWKYQEGGMILLKLKDASSIDEDGIRTKPMSKCIVQIISQPRSVNDRQNSR